MSVKAVLISASTLHVHKHENSGHLLLKCPEFVFHLPGVSSYIARSFEL